MFKKIREWFSQEFGAGSTIGPYCKRIEYEYKDIEEYLEVLKGIEEEDGTVMYGPDKARMLRMLIEEVLDLRHRARLGAGGDRF